MSAHRFMWGSMARRRRRRRGSGFRWWWPVAGLGALVALVVIVLVAGWLWLRGSLPETDGERPLAGLGANVDVIRDENGIPHVFAANKHDAYMALGFVHAQDRLWQMEFNRRVGAARLSEMFGERTLSIDRFLRTLGLYDIAAANYARYDEDVRAIYQAYSDGVNAYLETRSGPLPPEFILLGHEPEPWQPVDSIAWMKMMAWDLGGNMYEEVLRGALVERLGPARVADLWPTYPEDGPIALARAAAIPGGLGAEALLAALPLRPTPGAGSNNWVLAGRHTASGKPMLANDPHLGLHIPSLWYFAHLSAPGLEIIGATFPGVPAFVLGRTNHFAWGFTNTNPDVQDLFIERIDPADPDRYLTPTGSAPFETRDELIAVKDAADVSLQVRRTRHGPVINGILDNAEAATPAGHVLAFAWTALAEDDMTGQAAIRANHAADWDSWVAAMREFHVPQQNMVFADTHGNIGFLAPGRVPIRRNGSGWTPSPGWDGSHDWVGYVPFPALPRVFNPPSGQVVTANNRIVGPDYGYFITEDWAPPFRAQRIEALLAQTAKHDVDSFTAIQRDIVSLGARDFAPELAAIAEPEDAESETAIALIGRWDGSMDRARIEPLIWFAWLRELSRALFADDLGPLFRDYWTIGVAELRGALADSSPWCDDQDTPVAETCGEIAGRALAAALADLTARYGADPDSWRWGAAHYAYSEHRVLGQIPGIGPLFEIRLENGGARETVNAAGFTISNDAAPFAQNHGPGYRAIYDLAAPDRSLFIHTTGQSGNPFSSHYQDFAESWRDGRLVPMVTDRARIETGAEGHLRLLAP